MTALYQTKDLDLLISIIWVTMLFYIWKICTLSGKYGPRFLCCDGKRFPWRNMWAVLWVAGVFVFTHTQKQEQNKKQSNLRSAGSQQVLGFYFTSWQIKEVIDIASWKCANFRSLIADTWLHRGCRLLLIEDLNHAIFYIQSEDFSVYLWYCQTSKSYSVVLSVSSLFWVAFV